MIQERAARGGIGPVLALIGGLLVCFGSFMAWAKVSAQGLSVDAKGTDGSDGWITFVAGALLVLLGLLAFARIGRKVVAVLAIVAGLVGGGLALYDAFTAKDRVIDQAAEDIAGSLGVSKDQAKTVLNAAIDQGLINLSLSLGIFLVIGGGGLGVVGGVLMMSGRGQVAQVPAMDAVTPSMPATPSTTDWDRPSVPEPGPPEQQPSEAPPDEQPSVAPSAPSPELAPPRPGDEPPPDATGSG